MKLTLDSRFWSCDFVERTSKPGSVVNTKSRYGNLPTFDLRARRRLSVQEFDGSEDGEMKRSTVSSGPNSIWELIHNRRVKQNEQTH